MRHRSQQRGTPRHGCDWTSVSVSGEVPTVHQRCHSSGDALPAPVPPTTRLWLQDCLNRCANIGTPRGMQQARLCSTPTTAPPPALGSTCCLASSRCLGSSRQLGLRSRPRHLLLHSPACTSRTAAAVPGPTDSSCSSSGLPRAAATRRAPRQRSGPASRRRLPALGSSPLNPLMGGRRRSSRPVRSSPASPGSTQTLQRLWWGCRCLGRCWTASTSCCCSEPARCSAVQRRPQHLPHTCR